VCPREACPEPAFVAQLRLTGPDRALVARLAQDPAAFAASLKPTPRRNARHEASPPAAPPRVVAPLFAGRWRGAVFRIDSLKAPARAAHAAVLADSATGEVLLVVAQSSAAAERLARQALE
jgi:hypothetical protein